MLDPRGSGRHRTLGRVSHRPDGWSCIRSAVAPTGWVQRYNQCMDFFDWLLAIGLVALITVAFGLLLPPYGYIGGALIGAFLAWRALRQRRELLKKQKDDNQ